MTKRTTEEMLFSDVRQSLQSSSYDFTRLLRSVANIMKKPSQYKDALNSIATVVEQWGEKVGWHDQEFRLNRISLGLAVGSTADLVSILVSMEMDNMAAIAARIERSYNSLLTEAGEFDQLCMSPAVTSDVDVDVPDKEGFVRNPKNLDDYLPTTEIANRLDFGMKLDAKKLEAIS